MTSSTINALNIHDFYPVLGGITGKIRLVGPGKAHRYSNLVCNSLSASSVPLMAVKSRHTYKNCVVLLFYVHGKHLRSCRDGQLT